MGDGPERGRLEELITDSHLESCVQITWFLSGAALQRELQGVGTVVIPTIMEETAGLAALEQMAHGRTLMVSDVGGLSEAVEGAGITFPPGDSSALAEAMRRIMNESGLASSLAVLARRRVVQSFSPSAMIDAHAGVYRELYRGSLEQ